MWIQGREEHGSAKWGNASAINKKYQDKNPSANKLLTQNVRIGLDGRKHRRNLNILCCGGSGAGKTRFFCKPNAMQCNTSMVVLDPMDENRCIIARADKKIEKVALQIINGDYPQEGITLVSHIIGLLGQRLWFYKKTKGYSNKLKINNNCIGCGKCVSICPMKNLILRNKKVVSNDRCTMCYRCISLCPQKAITLLGNEVVEQYRIEDYR